MAKKKAPAKRLPLKSTWRVETAEEPEDEHEDGGNDATVPGQELLDALGSIHLDSKYSDLTVLCGDEAHAVHKCLICPRSGFFAKACDGQFQEASTDTVMLHDEEPALVKQMINYFYTLDYYVDIGDSSSDQPHTGEESLMLDSELETFVNDEAVPYRPSEKEMGIGNTCGLDKVPEASEAVWGPLSFHILMYALADRMFIEGLKTLSRNKVERELRQRLDPNSFPAAISEIYNSTPAADRGLRDLAVRMTMDHLTELRLENPASPSALHNGLLQSVPQYSYDLLVASIDRTVSEWGLYGRCERNWSGPVSRY